MRARRGVLLAALAAALVAAFLLATALLFVWPSQNRPGRADALVVFAGNGERIARATSLMGRNVAKTLVVSTGEVATVPICGAHVAYEVVCLTPQPVNTQGEARAFARLAVRRRWDRIVLVTSTYHLARARLLVGRCWHGRLVAVGAGSPWRASEIEHVAVEWTAMLRSWVFERGC